MKTLKVGLIGLGAISERHFAAFSACSQVRITALCTRSETNLAKRCAAWNIDAGYTDYRKMIEEAARESSEELAPYLLKSVTDDLSYEYLEFDDTLGRIPVGKTDFYGYRRKFYACLLKKRV